MGFINQFITRGTTLYAIAWWICFFSLRTTAGSQLLQGLWRHGIETFLEPTGPETAATGSDVDFRRIGIPSLLLCVTIIYPLVN